MNRTYTVYALTCEGAIRYIGITSRTIRQRLSQHLADARRSHRKEHKTNWIRKCIASGKQVSIKQLRCSLTQERAFAIEKQIIRKLRDRLVNTHEGGTGGYLGLSDEAKARHSASMKKFTSDFPEKIKRRAELSKEAREKNRIKRATDPIPDEPKTPVFIPSRPKAATVKVQCDDRVISFRVRRWDEKRFRIDGKTVFPSEIAKVVAVALEGIL